MNFSEYGQPEDRNHISEVSQVIDWDASELQRSREASLEGEPSLLNSHEALGILQD